MSLDHVPDNLILSAEEFRYLRPCQFSQLTGIAPNNFAAWSNHRQISERSLARIADKLGMTKPELLKAFDLRRQDQATARAAQAKADQLIALFASEESA